MQDLAEYSKFREKAAASAARSLVSLFRDIAPGMLEKKDRGRGADLGAVPLAYGQAESVALTMLQMQRVSAMLPYQRAVHSASKAAWV